MKLSQHQYKGARDFYPQDKRLQNYMFDNWKRVVERYGYEQYDAPLLEPTDLYRAKSGEEIVNEQTYSFTDRGGRDITIRPEMTPTVSRMVAARRQELAYPARWYSIPNLWRYERPQHGRLREHWQLNVDMFGVATVDAELEMIMIANDLLKEFGATQRMYTIKVNSRRLTAVLMADYLKLDASGAHKMVKLLDRKDKMERRVFDEEAAQILEQHSEEPLADKRLRLLIDGDSMAALPKELQETRPVKQIQLLFTHLKDNGISNAIFDVSLMRGFDYYTDIVFEVHDNHPDNNRSMFGGGRYDGLVGMFGVEPVPTVGFGFGDVTMQTFLEAHELMPDLTSTTEVYIIPIGDTMREAQGIATLLRQEGVNTAIDVTGRKTDKQLKAAHKMNIEHVLFVGEQELQDEQFSLKNLLSGMEQKMSIERVITTVKDAR